MFYLHIHTEICIIYNSHNHLSLGQLSVPGHDNNIRKHERHKEHKDDHNIMPPLLGSAVTRSVQGLLAVYQI